MLARNKLSCSPGIGSRPLPSSLGPAVIFRRVSGTGLPFAGLYFKLLNSNRKSLKIIAYDKYKAQKVNC